MEQTLGTLAVPTRYSSTDHVPKVPSFFLLYVSPWLIVPWAQFFNFNFFLSFLVLWNADVMTFPPNSRSASLVFFLDFSFSFFLKKKGYLQQLDPAYLILPYLLQDKENMDGILPNLCLSVWPEEKRASDPYFLSEEIFFFSLSSNLVIAFATLKTAVPWSTRCVKRKVSVIIWTTKRSAGGVFFGVSER